MSALTSPHTAFAFTFTFTAIISVLYLCFAVWFSKLSPLRALSYWKSDVATLQRICRGTYAASVVVTLWANFMFMHFAWYYALAVGSLLGYMLAGFLYESPSSWRRKGTSMPRPHRTDHE